MQPKCIVYEAETLCFNDEVVKVSFATLLLRHRVILFIIFFTKLCGI